MRNFSGKFVTFYIKVFVLGNNLYYQSGPDSPARQLTFTGDEKFIFNGATDWLYEGQFYPRSSVTYEILYT